MRLRVGGTLGVLLVAITACTGSGTSVEATPGASDPLTLISAPAVGPSGASTPAPSPFTSAEHQVAAPVPPAGPLPSFNESPGCGGPQGVRGPYVERAGDQQPDSQAIGGPWGDFYGRDLAEVREHLVEMELPSGDGETIAVAIHDQIAPALQRVIENLLAELARGNVYPIETVSDHRPSTVDPWRYLSFHSVGAAIDVNHLANPYRADNQLITDMPDWFVAAWTDAGWCWGGAWQTIKDPMHFSWMGPRFTGDPAQPPMPPRTEPGRFDRSLTIVTGLGTAPAGSIGLLGDMDRDGAADAVRLTPWAPAGPVSVEVARAMYGFDLCWTLGPIPYPIPATATVLLEDRTGDGRPDLWVVDADESGIRLVVYTFASGFTEHLPPVEVPVPVTPSSAFLVVDYDRDGNADLYVVEPGDPATLTVWAGPGFRTPILYAALPVTAEAGWRFALGERDGDGVADLFAVGPEEVAIVPGATGYRGPAETLAVDLGRRPGRLQVTDLDGDGRGDLTSWDRRGTVTVHLGGDRSVPDGELLSWFLVGDDRDWEHRDGCPARDRGAGRL